MSSLDDIKDALAFIESNIGNLVMASDRKSVVVGALGDVAIEHGRSIVVLIENELFASALALIRPQFEACVKMLWLNRCATDCQIDTYAEKDKISKPSNMRDMVLEVEEKANAGGMLKHIHSVAWKAMNSYIHAGNLQVGKRFKNGAITPHWNEKIENELCQIIAVVLVLVYPEILLIANAEDRDEQASELAKILEPAIVPEQS